MKKIILTTLLLLGTLWPASATLFVQTDDTLGSVTGFSGGTASGVGTFNQTIVDGNPAAGILNTMSLAGLSGTLSSLTVTLNVSGGFNSGLYASLVHDGVIAVLLNRPGVNAGNPLGDLVSGFSTGYTTIDANSAVSPLASAGSFTGTANTSLTTTFGGSTSLNGNWSLYFADVVNGGGNATLHGWSLDIGTGITPVPEPVTLALVTFVAMLLALTALKWAWRTK
jgi:hypothetical protein